MKPLNRRQEIATAQNINIGQALINSGMLSEDVLIKFLETKLHTPFVNLDDYSLIRTALNMLTMSMPKDLKLCRFLKLRTR